MEKVVETKNCKHCDCKFEITDKDLEFYEKISPSFGGKKYLIPTPSLCPDCRQLRRESFRNERNLYKRNCDATGRQIISMYSPVSKNTVYSPEYWWSDKWNPLAYGLDFDFTMAFFEQIDALYKKVPLYALGVSYLTMQNSDYNNASGYLKDCYMLFNSDDDEKCYYGKGINRCNHCVDNFKVYDSDNLYECISCYNCNDSKYLSNSENCYKCDVSTNLINCKNCFGCFNLSGKQYYFFNEKYSKEDYERKVEDILQKYSYDDIRLNLLNSKRIVKEKLIDKNENSNGDYLYETYNCNSCYDCENISNSKYCYDLKRGDGISDNNYDVSQFGKGIINSYENITIGYNISGCLFCIDVWDNSSNCIYCICCSGNVKDCFGCVGLTNKQYCIFNKQYSKKDYEDLVEKILKYMINTGEWGEFFPSSLSPFGYSETECMEYFPLTKEEVLKRPVLSLKTGLQKGKIFNWLDYELPKPKVDKIIPASKLPKNIADIPDDILNRAIMPEDVRNDSNRSQQKPFRIIREELEFYRKRNLPIPRRHPDQRHLDRMKLRNPRKLHDRKCDKCSKEIKTTYSPERPEIVYCEECYGKQVY